MCPDQLYTTIAQNRADEFGDGVPESCMLVSRPMDSVERAGFDDCGGIEKMTAELCGKGTIVRSQLPRFFGAAGEKLGQRAEFAQMRWRDHQNGLAVDAESALLNDADERCDIGSDVICREPKAVFEIVRAEHQHDEIKWGMRFQARAKIGQAILDRSTTDWIIQHGCASIQAFFDDVHA